MDNKTKELAESIGALAESSVLYFRAVLGTGASIEEASRLTQLYISAILFPPRPNKEDA